MSCIVKTDNGIEVRAGTGRPSLLFAKILTLGKSQEKSIEIYNTLKDIDYDNKDANGEPNLTIGGDSSYLDNLLIALATAGISIQSMEDYKIEYKKRTGSNLADNVMGVTDTINNIIAFSKQSDGSLAEEAVHMATASIMESSQMKRAMSLIDTTTDMAKKYMKLYKDDRLVRKELVDKMITDYLSNPSSISGRIKSTIKSIINKIRSVFGKPSLEMLISQIANEINDVNFEISPEENQLQFMLEEDALDSFDSLDKFKVATEDFIDKLTEKLNRVSSYADKKILDEMIQNRNKKRDDLVIINSVNYIQQKIKNGHERLIAVVNQQNPNKREVAQQLRSLQDTFNIYEPYLKSLRKINNKENKVFKKELRKILDELSTYQEDFVDVRRNFMGFSLMPFFKANPKFKEMKDIEDMLLQGEELTFWDSMLSAMADANDDVLKVIDQYVKRTHIEIETQTKNDIKGLFTRYNKLVDKTFDRFFQKVNGELGRYLIGQHNTEQFDENREATFSSLRDQMGVAHDAKTRNAQFTPGTEAAIEYGRKLLDDYSKGKLSFTITRYNGEEYIPMEWDWFKENYSDTDKQVDELVDRAFKYYKVQQAKWFGENATSVDNAPQQTRKHFKRILDDALIGDMRPHKKAIYDYYASKVKETEDIKLTHIVQNIPLEIEEIGLDLLEDQKHDLYTALATIKSFQDQTIGEDYEGNVYFKFELGRPNDDYLNKDYAKLDNSSRDFLDYLYALKQKEFDMGNTSNLDLVPQMNKSVQERIESGDASGMYQSIKEALTISEDDTDLGGDGKGLPIFFRKKLAVEDMSRDLLSVFGGYAMMGNHYNGFNKVEASLLLMKEQLEEANVVKVVKDKHGNDVLEAIGKGGNRSKRLNTYLDMVMYKKSKLNETWAGKHTVRVTDFLMKWVSLNALGGNIYSGVANVFTSAATRMQEIVASRIVKDITPGAYTKAMKVYLANMTRSGMSYGTANSTDPFIVMSQYMGIMDDLHADMVTNDEGKSRFFNIVKQLPFAPNTIGEHAVAHNTALAMMADVKLMKDGKEIDLIDAMMSSVNENGEMKLEGFTWANTPDKEFTLEDARLVGLKINRQNQVLFGIYNEIDKSAAQQYVIGRMLGQFRKFFLPGIYRRWQSDQFDYQLGIYREGMYRSTGKFIGRIGQQVWQDKAAIWATTQKEWAALSDEKKKNIVRTNVELASITAAIVFGALLTSAAEDDEDNQFLAFAAYQANRHYREMSTFISINSALEIMKSPAAAVNQIEYITNIAFNSVDPLSPFTGEEFFPRYQDGTDETYAWRNTKRIIPFYKTSERILDAKSQFDMTK